MKQGILVCFLLFQCIFFRASKTEEFESLTPLLEYLIEVAEHHKKDPSQPVPIVAIAGCPGVGKTYFTTALARKLREHNVQCRELFLDHFILSHEERKKIGTVWDTRHLKVSELHAFLAEVASGKKQIEKPTRDQRTETTDVELFDLNGTDLLLFDGHYTVCSDSPLNFFSYCIEGIFLEANESDIRKWRWERDQQREQPRTTEQFEEHMEAAIQEYHRVIKSSKNNAAFIIQKDGLHNYHLDVVQ